MNCEEAHQNFTAFLTDRMNVDNTDEFIRHVENCTECRDELEVYYMAMAATGELSEEELESYDLTHLLSDKMEERKAYVKRHQFYRVVGAVAAVAMLIVSAYLIFNNFL